MITLNRPKALNALNLNMIRKIYPVLQVCQSKQKVALIFFQLILKYYRMVQQFKCLNCIVTVVTLSEKDHLWIWRWNIERSHWLLEQDFMNSALPDSKLALSLYLNWCFQKQLTNLCLATLQYMFIWEFWLEITLN